MVANRDDSDNPEASLQDELHELVRGLREQIQALRDEVQSLRRKRSPDGPDALLPRGEAAERLGVSIRTLDDMADAGEIQPVRIRGRVLYAPETLESYIRARAREGRSRG
jgi:excisionase family DNA binding protein